jgi:hypothetical protein
MKNFAPIHYDRRQVALMVKVAAFFSDNFAQEAGEISTRVTLIASGMIAPTPAVVRFLDLQIDGEGFVWNPR